MKVNDIINLENGVKLKVLLIAETLKEVKAKEDDQNDKYGYFKYGKWHSDRISTFRNGKWISAIFV